MLVKKRHHDEMVRGAVDPSRNFIPHFPSKNPATGFCYCYLLSFHWYCCVLLVVVIIAAVVVVVVVVVVVYVAAVFSMSVLVVVAVVIVIVVVVVIVVVIWAVVSVLAVAIVVAVVVVVLAVAIVLATVVVTRGFLTFLSRHTESHVLEAPAVLVMKPHQQLHTRLNRPGGSEVDLTVILERNNILFLLLACAVHKPHPVAVLFVPTVYQMFHFIVPQDLQVTMRVKSSGYRTMC